MTKRAFVVPGLLALVAGFVIAAPAQAATPRCIEGVTSCMTHDNLAAGPMTHDSFCRPGALCYGTDSTCRGIYCA